MNEKVDFFESFLVIKPDFELYNKIIGYKI